MKRLIILIPIFLIVFSNSSAQDIIILRNSDTLETKVIEVSPEIVRYKKLNNPDGPEYISTKEEIEKILYQNGKVDEFKRTNSGKTKPKRIRKYPAQMMFLIGSSIATLTGNKINNGYKANFAGGIGFEIPIDTLKINFVDIAFLYEVKGTKFEDKNVGGGSELERKGVYQSNEYITLSFAYKRYIKKEDGFYGKLGLYGGYLVGASIRGKVYDPGSDETKEFSSSVKGRYLYFDIGGTIGVGYSLPISIGEYLNYLTTEVRYNHSFYNIYDDDMGYFKEYNSSFLILVGLKFPL